MKLNSYYYLSRKQMEKIAYQVWHGLIDPDQLVDNKFDPIQSEVIKFAKDCKRQMKVKEY